MKGVQFVTILSALVSLAAADGGRVSLAEFQLSRCLGKQGEFLPMPGSCNQYIICIKGTAVISTCGEYHFNARESTCDLPINSGCISFGPEPLIPAESLCYGRLDGTKLPVPDSSSNFYLCLQEKAYLNTCGSQKFDETTMHCVDSNEKQKEAPMEPCRGVANGVRLPVAGNPRQYYFCLNNKYFIKDCGNLYFVSKLSACALWPEEEPPRIEAPAVVIPAQERPIQNFDSLTQKMCVNQRLGARVAVPGSCSEYLVCMGNTGILKNCGLMQFNPITRTCGLPGNVRCSVQGGETVYGAQSSVEHPTSNNSLVEDSLERPATSNSAFVQACRGQRDGIFVAAPGKCSEFYFCFRSHGYLKTCGSRHFSPITLSCVEPEESNCVEVFQEPAIQPAAVQVNNCLSRDSGVLLRHPSECGKFLICDNHVPKEMECPSGLHFNSERNYCDWPEMAGCI